MNPNKPVVAERKMTNIDVHIERIKRIQIELKALDLTERLLNEWGVLGNVGKYYDDLIKEFQDFHRELTANP